MNEETTSFTLPFSTSLDEGLLAVNAAGEIILSATEINEDETTAVLGNAKLAAMKLGG